MALDPCQRVHSQVSQGLVLFDTDAPEEGRCGRRAAIGPDLPFHAPDYYKKTFSVDRALDGHIMNELFTPEGLAPVDHDLCLCGQAAEIDRGRQNDPVGLSDSRIYLLHLILDDAYTRIGTAATVLTRLDVHVVEPEIFDAVQRPIDAF